MLGVWSLLCSVECEYSLLSSNSFLLEFVRFTSRFNSPLSPVQLSSQNKEVGQQEWEAWLTSDQFLLVFSLSVSLSTENSFMIEHRKETKGSLCRKLGCITLLLEPFWLLLECSSLLSLPIVMFIGEFLIRKESSRRGLDLSADLV